LQLALRAWISAIYFSDLKAYEDREAAYPVVLYQASRPFCGNPGHDFTLDLRDYPDCTNTLEQAWKLTGSSLRRTLAEVELRLNQAGRSQLAKSYAPKWYEDVLHEVRRNPKAYAHVLTKEADFINSIIDLAAAPTPLAVSHFSKCVNLKLKKVFGHDVRHLAVPALRMVTAVLEAREAAAEAQWAA